VSPNKIGKRKKGMSKLRDPESGSGSFEFTHVAVLESADYAGQGTVCADYFRGRQTSVLNYEAKEKELRRAS